jgi:replicative DNA helicase
VSQQNLPPQNIEAEESILGGCLLDPGAYSRIEGLITADSFYVQAHGQIFTAISQLASSNQPTDFLTVKTWLEDHHQLEAVGGLNKLTQLLDRTVSAVNIDRYALLVEDKANRRRLIATAYSILELANDTTLELETVFDKAEESILALRRQNTSSLSGLWSDVTTRQLNDIEEILSGQQSNDTIETTTLYDFDEMTAFERGDLVALMGASGTGKTALACCLAYQYASQGIPTFFWSLEQPEKQIWARIQASHSGIDSQLLGRSRYLLTPQHLECLTSDLDVSISLPIYLHSQKEGLSIHLNFAEQKFRRLGHSATAVLIVDYLQLLAGADPILIDSWTIRLKELSLSKNLLTIVLVQPEELSKRNNKRPTIGDISYCKTAKQHFDIILGLHREAYWNPDYPHPNEIEVTTLKHRHLPFPNSSNILGFFEYCRFVSLDKRENK